MKKWQDLSIVFVISCVFYVSLGYTHVSAYWNSSLQAPCLSEDFLDKEKQRLHITVQLHEVEVKQVDKGSYKIMAVFQGKSFEFGYSTETAFYLNGGESCDAALRPVTGEDFCLANLYFDHYGRLVMVEGLYYAINVEVQDWSQEKGYITTMSGEKVVCGSTCQWIFRDSQPREALILLDFQSKARKIIIS